MEFREGGAGLRTVGGDLSFMGHQNITAGQARVLRRVLEAAGVALVRDGDGLVSLRPVTPLQSTPSPASTAGFHLLSKAKLDCTVTLSAVRDTYGSGVAGREVLGRELHEGALI